MAVAARNIIGAVAIDILNTFNSSYSVLVKFRIVRLLKFIIPSPNANGGINRRTHAIPSAITAESSLSIHLKVKMIIGKSPPAAKLKKYTLPCALLYF